MIHEDVLPQLKALPFSPEKPLLIVDVDEVIVGLAGHLAEFAEGYGFSLELTGYQLDGALKRRDGSTATRDEFQTLFTEFFETQTRHQRAYDGAAQVLEQISEQAQIIILTNVPPYAGACRRANLDDHGIPYPLVVNQGAKGLPVAWLAQQTTRKTAFIDDSPTQITSVAKDAPDVTRIHYVGDTTLRGLLGPLADADHAPTTWKEIGTTIDTLFAY